MIYTEKYSEGISLAEALIKINECEREFFESVIELDFLELYHEKGVVTLSESQIEQIHEAEEEGQKSKFKAILEAIGNWFARVWESFIAAMQKLFNADKALLKKLEPYFKADKVKDCDAKGTTVNYNKYGTLVSALNNKATCRINGQEFTIANIISTKGTAQDSLSSDLLKVIDSEDFENMHAMTTKYCDFIRGNEFFDTFFNKEDKTIYEKLGSTGMSSCLNMMKSSSKMTVDAIKQVNTENKRVIDQYKSKIDAQVTNDSVERLSAFMKSYKLVASTSYSVLNRIAKEAIKTNRNNFVTLAMYAYKKDHGGKSADVNTGDNNNNNTQQQQQQTANASAIIYGMESDLFVESVFNM